MDDLILIVNDPSIFEESNARKFEMFDTELWPTILALRYSKWRMRLRFSFSQEGFSKETPNKFEMLDY